MTKNKRFSPAFEEGHFDGLVVEGKYLRQSLLYKQILPRTPSRPKTSVNPVILSISSSCPSCPSCASWLQNPFNQRNLCPRYLRLINDLCLYICRATSTNVMSALQIHLFLQNKAKFRKVKLNVNKVLTKDYEQLDTWSIRKKQSQTNPNKAKTNPKRTQFPKRPK